MQEGLFTDLFNANNGNIDINRMYFGSNLQVMNIEKGVAEVARTNHDPAWIMVKMSKNRCYALKYSISIIFSFISSIMQIREHHKNGYSYEPYKHFALKG